MILQQIFSEKNVFCNLESTDKDELFEEMVQHLVTLYPSIDRSKALDALIKREEVMTTGIMPSVAVPHGVMDDLPKTIALVGFSKKGIDYASLDGRPVHCVFMFFFCDSETDVHLKALKDLACLLQNHEFFDSLKDISSPQGFINLISKFDE